MANNGVTQYIGARYVPKFYENSQGTAEWRANVAYEPLVIVTYNGNSYTSKKPVPASVGNPSENPSYWASTGIYSEQVESLRREVAEYKEESETADDAINTRIDNLGKRKVIFISDSYADTNRGGFAKGIFTTFCTYAGLTSGTDAFLFARGGAGFVGAGQGVTFGDLVSQAITAHSNDGITDIVIAGGANDQDSTVAEINTAKDTVFASLRAAFPEAKIFIAMCSGFISAGPRKNLMSKVRFVYCNNAPNAFLIPIENAHLPMMLANRYTDAVHPNSKGCTEIGMCIASAFRENNTFGSFGVKFHQAANLPAGSDASNSLYMRYDMNKNGYLYYMAESASLGLAQAVEVAHNTGCTIAVGYQGASTDSDMLCANAESLSDTDPAFRIPCEILGYTNEAALTWVPIPGELFGVADANRNITWYFKARTGMKTFTMSQARWNTGLKTLIF